MALVLHDRVKETTTSTGTGTINLAGAATGFITFVAGIGNSNTTYYCIAHQSANEFEVGIGTITDASPDTITGRTNGNVFASSNSNNMVDFSAGTKDVFCTQPASKAVFLDSSGNLIVNGVSYSLGDAATKTVGIASGNVGAFTSGVADNDFLRIDGTSIEGRSASEVLSDIGGAGTGKAIAMAIIFG